MRNPNKIAIAISTRNRKESFGKCHGSVTHHTDADTDYIFTVDDASDLNYSRCASNSFRFEERQGISIVKNKCLELCMNTDADHFFLLDDDVRVLKDDWWRPYVESGEHHLCATFLPKHRIIKNSYIKDVSPENDIKSPIYQIKFENRDVILKSHLLGNGYCLYFTRHCIEQVGGFDTNYKNKYEHCCLSRRIFNAGLTKYIYQDVINSNELIYCLDQDNAIQRSFTEREMQDNLKAGYDYFRSQAKSKKYIEFRT